MRSNSGELRILAIDPIHKGFGYVVTEGESLLVDWGVAHVRGPKHSGCLRRLGELVEQYAPDVVLIEDPAVDSRRWARVTRLLQNIREWGEKRGVRVRMLSRRRVRNVFADWNANTKEEIASVIALRFPELALRLPPHRKCYMSEDARMSIFDAAALSIAVFAERRRETGQKGISCSNHCEESGQGARAFGNSDQRVAHRTHRRAEMARCQVACLQLRQRARHERSACGELGRNPAGIGRPGCPVKDLLEGSPKP